MVQDIIDGLSGFATGIGGTLINLIVNFLGLIVNIVLFPVNSLFSLIFPNFSETLTTFSIGLTNLAMAPIGYFAYHIPPLTKSVLAFYLLLLVGYYSYIWIYRSIIIIPKVINKIKFW